MSLPCWRSSEERGGWSRVRWMEEEVTSHSHKCQITRHPPGVMRGLVSMETSEAAGGWGRMVSFDKVPSHFSRFHSICCVASKSTADKRRGEQYPLRYLADYAAVLAKSWRCLCIRITIRKGASWLDAGCAKVKPETCYSN